MVVITSEGRRPEAPRAICEIARSAVDQLVLEVATGLNYWPETSPKSSTQARGTARPEVLRPEFGPARLWVGDMLILLMYTLFKNFTFLSI